jgi:DNA-binding NtrC family response regulator
VSHPGSQHNGRPLAVIVEEDQLTSWSLHSYLSPTFRIALCKTFKEASQYLSEACLRVVLLGNPIAAADRPTVVQLAARQGVRVVALVSDAEQAVPRSVTVIEKPFALGRLAEVLNITGGNPKKG